MKPSKWAVFAVCLALAMAVGVVALQAQDRETFTGMLAQMSGPAAGATGSLQITVDRWSTPEERQAYFEAIAEGQSEKTLEGKQRRLLSMMEDARGAKRVGFARFPRTLGWDLTYAWQFMDGSTRVIRLATNRPVPFIEARNNYRTMDYPFGIIELRLNEKGEGEGTVFQAASVTVNKEGVLSIESYGIGPQPLLSVRARVENK